MRYYSKRRKASMSFDLRQNGYLERSRIRSMRLGCRVWSRDQARLDRSYSDYLYYLLTGEPNGQSLSDN